MQNKEVFEQLVDQDIVNVYYTNKNEIICKFRFQGGGLNYLTMEDIPPIANDNEKTVEYVQTTYLNHIRKNSDTYDMEDIEKSHMNYLSYTIEGSVGKHSIIDAFYESTVTASMFDCCEINLETSYATYAFRVMDINSKGEIISKCVGVKINNNHIHSTTYELLFEVNTLYSLEYIERYGCIIKNVNIKH